MTTGYVLILAMLVLGCAIATVGDQIGTKVGKARLSLFNLRPRKTATLVTVVTGGFISASTLAILLLLDQRLRTGLFQLEEIQQDLYSARQDFENTQSEKRRVEAELDAARNRAVLVQERLDALDRSLERVSQELAEALEEQVQTQQQLRQTETQLENTEAERRQAEQQISRIESQLQETEAQRESLEVGIFQLQRQQQQLQAAADVARRQLEARDRELERNRQRLMTQEGELARQEKERSQQAMELLRQELELAQREELLASLSQQQMNLQQELQRIGQDFLLLRERRLAILQQQVLTSARVRVMNPEQVDEVILQILQEANRVASQVLRPGIPTTEDPPTLQVESEQIHELRERLAEGQEYVVRVRSSRNYLLGEAFVQGFLEVLPNQVIFEADEVVAEVVVDLDMNLNEVFDRVYWLLEAARFQGERQGILPAQIQMVGGRNPEFREFVERLLEESGEVRIQAVSQDLTYTSGPLFLSLKVLQDEEVLFELTVDN